jgi:hypothetical protein
MADWADQLGIVPEPLGEEGLQFLAAFALGLRATTTGRDAEGCREIGSMMAKLLAYVAHLEGR